MHELISAIDATWSPFVLVTGLLLIGHVAAGEGLFRFVGSRCAKVPGGGVSLFIATMLTVALVTAVLNLDTSVVFMTPIALHAARARGVEEEAFLYGTVFMSNSASLVLVGSNLTNLLVFSSRHLSGVVFASHMYVAWITAVLVTILVVTIWRWRALRGVDHTKVVEKESARFGTGVAGALFAVFAMLAIARPALWVLVAGVVAELYEIVVRRRTSLRDVFSVVSPYTLSLLFVVAVAVGWFARSTTITRHLLSRANEVATIATAAITALVINNLPAASLFAAHDVAHPYALLLGLDLGPNIALTGALSSLLWLGIARRNGARPSIRTFSLIGSLVALASMACAATLFAS